MLSIVDIGERLFRNDFVKVLSVTSKTRTECLIAVGFNVDLLKYDENADTEDVINKLYEHSFIPLISRPTPFNINSSSLIDNIFSNRPYDSLVSGILITDVSDHFPLFYISKLNNPQNKKIAIKRETRITFDKNFKNLKQTLLAVDWSALQSSYDVNSAYDLFLSKFLKIYNRELPIVNKNISHIFKNHKPWVTAGILKSIHHKHHLYANIIQYKDSKSESKYEIYKNKLTRIVRMAECTIKL